MLAMVDVVSQLPAGGSIAQVRGLGPRVGGGLALFCIHRMNRVYGAPVVDMLRHLINVVSLLLLLLLLVTGVTHSQESCTRNLSETLVQLSCINNMMQVTANMVDNKYDRHRQPANNTANN